MDLIRKIQIKESQLKQDVFYYLKDEKGDGVITFLIFTCILVLGVLAISGTVQAAFADLAGWFATTVIARIKTVLS